MKILKFGAIWCPSCLIMNNTINKLKKNYPNLEVVNYDYDMEEELVNKYNIGSILPVLIFVNEDNKEINRVIGEKNEKELIKIIESIDV